MFSLHGLRTLDLPYIYFERLAAGLADESGSRSSPWAWDLVTCKDSLGDK